MGTPPTVNSPEKTLIAIDAAKALVGTEKTHDVAPTTGAEDFAFILREKPGAFVRIGNGSKPDGSFDNVHTPFFDFNDAALPYGSAYWASLVMQELASC